MSLLVEHHERTQTMNFNSVQFASIVENAKKAAASSPRWTRAITRAAEALQSGEFVVTLLHNGALVTSPNGSYFVNGHCSCPARSTVTLNVDIALR
jgi:hypothetical protein